MEESPCRNSTVSSDSHLEIGHLTIVILVVLSRVNLQFQDRFVPISLRPLLTPGGGFSLRQLMGHGAEYYL